MTKEKNKREASNASAEYALYNMNTGRVVGRAGLLYTNTKPNRLIEHINKHPNIPYRLEKITKYYYHAEKD